jgi:hypothetical protein
MFVIGLRCLLLLDACSCALCLLYLLYVCYWAALLAAARCLFLRAVFVVFAACLLLGCVACRCSMLVLVRLLYLLHVCYWAALLASSRVSLTRKGAALRGFLFYAWCFLL